MIDLRHLRTIYTDGGARDVFEELVLHCVKSLDAGARRVRPNPGDEGVDTFVGTLGESVNVWQAKYFPDGLGPSQKGQVRESFKTCLQSEEIGDLKGWTLCVPTELSIDEMKWWQKWSKEQGKKSGCSLQLWTNSEFVGFAYKPQLRNIFSHVLGGSIPDEDQLLARLRERQTPAIRRLPDAATHSSAVFVQKLEAANVQEHRAARTAFYNFELLRQAVEQTGDSAELDDLEDMVEKVRHLWEQAFNGATNSEFGKALYLKVNEEIEDKARDHSAIRLPTHPIHKQGALLYVADLCQAGWTPNYRSVLDEPESTSESDDL